MSCQNCPCPDICLKRDIFCEWAATSPSNPIEIKAICERSRLGANPQPSQYPSSLVQAKNLWRSIKGFVASGGRLASKADRQKRTSLCVRCVHYDLKAKRCMVCGCATSAKVYIAADKCPLDPPRWGPI